MNQTTKTFTPERADARKWIGRIMMAVILGEAIWNLIVSVMNNLVVPWLGDVMGPSSGVPTSFTQRPYDYPDLFVSVLELCIAGIVAVIVNYLFQRQMTTRVKSVKTSVPTGSAKPAQVAPQSAPASAMTGSAVHANSVEPVATSVPDTQPAPATVTPAALPPSLAIPPQPVATPMERPVVTEALSVGSSPPTNPASDAANAETPELKKLKEVYYNIVGEPIASDED